MITPFHYQVPAADVTFGAGERKRASEVLQRLGVTRAMVISGPRHEALAQELAEQVQAAGVFSGAAMHTPVEVTTEALEATRAARADGILSIGGGSAIGLGKAIALRTDLEQLVLPTTFAGSEMSPILGETENGIKTTQRTPKVQPEAVIYDAELLMSLPPEMAGPSAMNAMAHAVEALYAPDGNPVINIMAGEAICALGEALPRVMEEPGDVDGWSRCLYGAFLAGICLGAVSMGLHHKICHTLGGSFDLPHADIHCLMLPYATAYNREAAPEAMASLAIALNAKDGAGALHDLMLQVARVKSLKDFGLTQADLEKAADLAADKPYANPRPVTRDGVLAMLQQAWNGERP